ncbi:murein DD-endopeptidase MepM/ murein hydrolase activator NlpD [Saccharopolyspora lacisalsi]|uniref:Murein DD-endopeptidase MepM/ murein hydrolase activator NlpD n=1 Tax=Halosaccharopolyspora lacisalsi TaxID=1000566 RepID=A0A839DX02_9PSEU|nr:M23 family metallopeptidase [Halosaccharopolyspora lacisalsi]MBA8823268.1 murein DD-endopeptidase MepM/ murein hydrolase activator NlpD [Halosaccharopolyspora lacisalsi]
MRPLIATLVLTGTLGASVVPMSTPARAPETGPAPVRTPPSSATNRGGFDWPLPGAHEVVRDFDPPVTEYGPGHRGVDLAASTGRSVRAAGPGVIVYAGRLAGRGVVSVEHAGGLRTTYEPVAANVMVGQTVRRGQPIGRLDSGHPECIAPAPRTCLHWGARQHDDHLNPLRLLSHTTARLLPWRGRSDHDH